MSKMLKMLEVTTPFGSHRVEATKENMEAARRLREFYESPEGREILAGYAADEDLFHEHQREIGLWNPTRLDIGTSVTMQIIEVSGELDDATELSPADTSLGVEEDSSGEKEEEGRDVA